MQILETSKEDAIESPKQQFNVRDFRKPIHNQKSRDDKESPEKSTMLFHQGLRLKFYH